VVYHGKRILLHCNIFSAYLVYHRHMLGALGRLETSARSAIAAARLRGFACFK